MPVIKQVYLFEESHLPEKGWLQGCVVCGLVTSRIQLFKIIGENDDLRNVEAFSYLCPKCKKKLSNREFNSKYIDICDKILQDELHLSSS